jgi:exosome complex RNA-binding protein Rrp42 (RNase PH superfamily)
LLASSVRVDGRAFAACRDMKLSSDIVHAVLSSASISIGRTVVIAGVQAAPGFRARIQLRVSLVT